jgi:glycyl-tRNA synthetase
MAYITKQKINGKDYFYLRKSLRENGKVISKHIAYLGKTREEAEEKMKEILKNIDSKNNSMGLENNNAEKKELSHKKISVEELAKFCKDKGFVYRSSDIYGGFSGFWDYGPLGVELFNNLKQNWWGFFVHEKENVVGMEGSIISHPRTWEASGHLKEFNDVFVKCKKCGRTGKLDENELGKVNCPDCGGDYESQGKFNLMFETKVGAGENSETAYLRGETAQGMFLDFKLINQTTRQQLPFGIAQIGRCFRNEIAPRDFLFRSREFHIAEIEFFINPEEKKCLLLDDIHLDTKFKFLSEEKQHENSEELEKFSIKDLIEKGKIGEWHAYWLAEQIIWFRSLGLDEIKIREHTKEELSHYSSATFDIDYGYPFGSKEVAGNANRGQFDLIQHAKESKEKMEIFDDKTGKRVLPRVIEPTFGLERVFLALLTKAYCVDEKNNTVLKLPFNLAPIKAAVFPLIKKEEFEILSKEIVNDLKKEGYNVVYDKSGSIGRRYARNDEIGTPFCITVDDESLKNEDVTIRFRDTKEQKRIKIKNIKKVLRDLIKNKNNFSDL